MKTVSLFLLLTAACSGCSRAVTATTTFEPVILRYPTMPRALATTSCSMNNLPIIFVDSLTWESPDLEIVLRHEEVHARRAYAYRGGCWPFMYRINKDKAFRAKEQLVAFCVAARFALKRNRNPEDLWAYIINVMRPDTTLLAKDNCLYEPWEQ